MASDVTTIWPLPVNAAQLDTMLAATSMGAHGELLPAQLYQMLVRTANDTSAVLQQMNTLLQ